MENFYLFAVIILFALAIIDLVVGVSNDAVNFLNSAIGSKVAPRKVILIVASVGIFIGASFSSGMMEIARKGIFDPSYFYFSEIMFIFLAVMLTDIILLDLFNTYGMPTSTTVSIVFELLGAAVIISLLKLINDDSSINMLGDYINSEKAIQIISGIFLSVLIAFTVGALVQYISRIIFSFHYHERLKYVGAIWGGIATTSLTYFLLVKGLKGASFVPSELIEYVKDNNLIILVIMFGFWTVLMQILLIIKVNILKFVVLLGTFCLAMAFAGNDLVNFIGVPVAGFESYSAWTESGVASTEFSMDILANKVKTNPLLLLLAGIVMVATLWFSKKARSVTETEVSLGRQDEGEERFKPNALARIIVDVARQLGKGYRMLFPKRVFVRLQSNFKENTERDPEMAFDLIRATVNLTVASILISMATSLKLPLSTTYVSFMVAMGSSLSDKAWGRESAVYRVAGVMNVIGGWFLTAVIAFSIAGLFAFLLYEFEWIALIGIVLLVIYSLVRNSLFHKAKEKEKEKNSQSLHPDQILSYEKTIKYTTAISSSAFNQALSIFQESIEGLINEDKSALKKTFNKSKEFSNEIDFIGANIFKIIKKIDKKHPESGEIYMKVYDILLEVSQSTRMIAKLCKSHVENSHKPLKSDQIKNLLNLENQYAEYFIKVINQIQDHHFDNPPRKERDEIKRSIKKFLKSHIERISDKSSYSIKNHMIYSKILLESEDLVKRGVQLIVAFEKDIDLD